LTRRYVNTAAEQGHHGPTAPRASTAQPNIVYILCDDLGYGDVQCLNPDRGKIPTPRLDAFSRRGMVFTDAHSGSAVCSPTRYGLLTGRYAWRSRLQAGVVREDQPCLIAPDRLTLPGFLRNNGYHTACFGKWHLGYTYADDEGRPLAARVTHDAAAGLRTAGVPPGTTVVGGPVDRGFDRHVGFQRSRTISTLVRDHTVAEEIRIDRVLQRLGQEACRYLERRAAQADTPFFLYLPLNSPHAPVAPSADWGGRSGLGDYGDFVMETDWVVGEVLDTLDRLALADDTLVIFTSDNGCSAGAANAPRLEQQFGHYPSAHLRGYKSDIWEGGHRVPFFVRWPGHVRAGAVNHQLICLNDMMRFCADLLGIELPGDAAEDSVSLRPTLLDDPARPVRTAVVHHSISGKFSIRRDEWKLEVCPGSGGWTLDDADARRQGLPDLQLYNIAADAVERHNLVHRYPALVEELLRDLEAQVADGRTTPGAGAFNDVEVVIRK
jgi:arylsulfatase A-like enzyme